MGRFAIAIAVIILGAVLITFILGRIFSRNVFVKYIPALLMLLLGVYNIYRAYTATGTFEDLASFLLAVFLFVGVVSGALTGLFMDYIQRRKGNK